MKPTANSEKKTTEKRNALRFSKVVIALVLVSVAIFTVSMTVIFCITGGTPDTLITAFFAFAGGEAGVLGFLKWAERKKIGTDDDSANSEPDTDADEAVG